MKEFMHARELSASVHTDGGLGSMGESALRKHRSLYSPERNAQVLLSVYQQALSMGVHK